MTALASTDLTLTVSKTYISRKFRESLVKITFGDAALTYPSGGVALPSFASSFTSYGMKKVVDYVEFVDSDDASGIVWKIDHDNKKLRGYIQGVVVSAAASATLDDYGLNTTTDPQASTVSLGLENGQSAGTVYFGKLKELATTHAPAAQTLYIRALGQ